jgi:hypothetical protein
VAVELHDFRQHSLLFHPAPKVRIVLKRFANWGRHTPTEPDREERSSVLIPTGSNQFLTKTFHQRDLLSTDGN